MPTYRSLTRSRMAMRVAFAADALVGGDRNTDVPPRLQIPMGRTMPRHECLRLFPGARTKHLTGGALWYDYQMRNTDRLTLAFGLAAAREGACLANYVRASTPLKPGGHVSGMRVRDGLSGETFDVRATLTLNAAGAGAGRVMEAFGAPQSYPLIKAANLVTRRPMTGPALAASTDSGRMLFAVPWQGLAMAGTFHSENVCPPDDLGVSAEDLAAYLAEINQAFPDLHLAEDDVSLVHRGLMLAARDRSGAWMPEGHFRIRDHALDGVHGAVSLIGVKYTTARGVAAEAVDFVLRRLGRNAPCRTDQAPLPGGDVVDLDALQDDIRRLAGCDSDVAIQLAQTYGSEAKAVVGLMADPALKARVTPGVPVVRAQVVHAVRHEMACTLTDVVARRTPLGAAGYPGRDVAERCAAVMAGELVWSQARVEREEAALEAFYAPAKQV